MEATYSTETSGDFNGIRGVVYQKIELVIVHKFLIDRVMSPYFIIYEKSLGP
jgi:hypothetical protein